MENTLTKENTKRMWSIDMKLTNGEKCTDDELAFYYAHFEWMCEDEGEDWSNKSVNQK